MEMRDRFSRPPGVFVKEYYTCEMVKAFYTIGYPKSTYRPETCSTGMQYNRHFMDSKIGFFSSSGLTYRPLWTSLAFPSKIPHLSPT